jgi:hypothetical protein
MERVNDGVYLSVSGYVNAYLIDEDDGVIRQLDLELVLDF